MLYNRLGKSGLKVSAISLGSWMTYGQEIEDIDIAEQCMRAAYDAGVNFFDGAEVYGLGAAEHVLGEVFKRTQWSRDTLVISSKVMRIGEHPNQKGSNRKHLVEACDAALQRMHLDYLDLFYCHRPDPETPMEETVRTMQDLITQGKILYWGTSMFSGAQIMEAFAVADKLGMQAPTMEQPIYNMLSRDRVEKELKLAIDNYGLGTTVYSPLQMGILTGKYNNGIPKDSRLGGRDDAWLHNAANEGVIEKCKQLAVVADDLGIPQARLALAWCLKNPDVSTLITGASRASQVEENIKAVDDLTLLTDEVMQRIEDILNPKT